MTASRRLSSSLLSSIALTPLAMSVVLFPVTVAGIETESETGHVGTDDADSIVAIGPIEVIAEVEVLGVDVPLFGPDDFDGTISAEAEANGVLALGGEDLVVITDPVSADADARATGATISGSLSGDANAAIEVRASAGSAGIDGGDQDDDISVADEINSRAEAAAVAATISVAIDSPLNNADAAGNAIVEANTVAATESTVIYGGAGDDQVDIFGAISAISDAAATNVGVSFGMAFGSNADVDTGAAINASSNTASATAKGIDGGIGADTISNHGTVDLEAQSAATAVNVGLTIGGSVRGDAATGGTLSRSETNAGTEATGISGGEGDDKIVDTGSISVSADSEALAVSAGYSLSVSQQGQASGGGGVSDASTSAVSHATAIDGGDGDDQVTAIQAQDSGIEVTSTANAVGIAATFSVAGSVKGDAVGGEALSDTVVESEASAAGIVGGAGSDTIISDIDIDTTSDANATGVTVSYSAGVSKEGDVTAGAAASQASTIASADSVSIDGGDDDDEIGGDAGTRGQINTSADATATGVSVSFSVGGSLEGSAEPGDALSEARTEASAAAFALGGGQGNDKIINAAGLKTDATATATAVSASFAVGITSDGEVTNPDASAEGGAMSDASSMASALAVGLDGGSGVDTISSIAAGEQRIDVSAVSQATGVAASFDVGGSIKGDASAGDALGAARTDASAATIGIDGGSGSDTIDSLTTISAESDATATAVAAGISVGIAREGSVTAGSALSDASSRAVSGATGIAGGAGDDGIGDEQNGITGGITAIADSTATGVAASITLAGTAKGGAESGGALSAARTDAEAVATGIDGGTGIDTIISSAGISSEATSTSTAVSAGFDVTISKDGDVSTGAAISDASARADTLSVGIDGGDGDDAVTATTADDLAINSSASSAAYGVAASFSVAGSASGSATAGDALSEARTDAESHAAGISGGAGADQVNLIAGIDADANATATAVSAGFSVEITKGDNSEGNVSGAAALSDASSLAVAQAYAIDSGSGDDDIIAGGVGEDILDVSADAEATGVAVSVTVSGQMQGDVTSGGALSEASVTSNADATAIAARDDDDGIVNSKDIVAGSDATATGVSVGIFVGITADGDITNENAKADGSAVSNASGTASARSAAIDAGDGDDEITNSGSLNLRASSNVTGVAVSIGVAGSASGDVEGGAASDASVAAESVAVGLEGGSGRDAIYNEGTIRVMDGQPDGWDTDTDANATAVAVSLNVSGSLSGDTSGSALSDTSSTASAIGTGISGGSGIDSIDNRGDIIADVGADANATSVSVDAGISIGGDTKGAALSDSSTNSQARATAIDGGDDVDDIDNLANLATRSYAESDSVSVSVSLAGSVGGIAEGAAVASAAANSTAASIGVDGGAGDDIIDTTGKTFDEANTEEVEADEYSIYSLAETDAAASAVAVSVTGAIGAANAGAMADASANGNATATGMYGGAGDDTIDNASRIEAYTESIAEASSTSVTVAVGIGETESNGLGDSSASASATATGIDGGDGADTITNNATLTAGRLDAPMAEAEAGSTSVGVGITLGVASSETGSSSASVAAANAAGISGGSGDDTITNSGMITAGIASDAYEIDLAPLAVARAGSQTVDVGVTIGAGSSQSSADSSSTATAGVAAIDGGAGADIITNTGYLSAVASAEAISESKTTSVSLSLGSSEGDASADATSAAFATSAGIDGGAGNDVITFEGSGGLYSAAEARASAESASLSLSIIALGDSDQSAAAFGSSSADAIARGLYGAGGNDTVNTSTAIDVFARADVTSDIDASVDAGFGIGEIKQDALSQADTTARSLAIGIDGGSGNDDIDSNGVVTVFAVSTAESNAESSTHSGFNLAGSSAGESMSDARATVSASGVAIRGGEQTLVDGETDDDTIAVTQAATVTAESTGTSTSTADTTAGTVFGNAEGRAVSDASAVVLASGTGIEGGAGNDEITTITVFADETVVSRGDVAVTSEAKASVVSTSTVNGDVTFGDASAMGATDASVDMLSAALGIDAGAGADTVIIDSLIDVTAISSGEVRSTSNANADTTFGDASSGAMSDASAVRRAKAEGIQGGDGADVIGTSANAELLVMASSTGSVTSSSYANADSTFGDASSSTRSQASSLGVAETAGIAGGAGDDEIGAGGRIMVSSNAGLSVTNSSIAKADAGIFGDSYAGAVSDTSVAGRAVSSGISGNDGDNSISTSGSLEVSARSITTVVSMTAAIAESKTIAASRNTASSEVIARGIEGGAGADKITAGGTVAVAGQSSITSISDVYSNKGSASSDARTLATADATGIRTAGGDDSITADGDLLVAAAPEIRQSSRTFGSRGLVNGSVGIQLSAVAAAIDAGEGADTVNNTGELLVVVGRQAGSNATVATAGGDGDVQLVLVDAGLTGRPVEEIIGKWLRIDLGGGQSIFTPVDDFDPETGTITTRVALPETLAGSVSYLMFDVDGGAGIELNTATVGGNVHVDASTSADVVASGITGGDGEDTITNVGGLTVRAANRTVAGTRTVGGAITADLSTTSNVYAIGIDGDRLGADIVGGVDSIHNLGGLRVDAISQTDFSNAEFSFGGQNLTATGISEASATGISAGTMNDDIQNDGTLDSMSHASIFARDRAVTAFSNINQQLDFTAHSHAIGIRSGDGDDSIRNDGSIGVDGIADASVLGYSATYNIFPWTLRSRTTNVVDASVTSTAGGLELGDGTDSVSNGGRIRVHADSGPVSTYVAQAIADAFFDETGASANAVNNATAHGIVGDGADVTNTGEVEVTANSVSTSYAAASEILVADDQSSITGLPPSSDFKMTDAALEDSTLDPTGKTIRFIDDSIDFTRREATISTIDNGDADNLFTDADAIGLDPAAVEGTTIRFTAADGSSIDYVGVVESFDTDSGQFTLTDALPTDLAADDGYRLSVQTATVTDFDDRTGTFTIDEHAPDGAIGTAYSLSVISQPDTLGPGGYVFADATRQDEDPADLEGSWVRFPGAPGFIGVIEDFDNGTFTLTCIEGCDFSFDVLAGELYELSATRDGSSGSTSFASAYGIELTGVVASVRNSGEINVTATADASTTARATYGTNTASADAVAIARGIDTGAGDDTIINEETGSIDVVASASAASTTSVQTVDASAVGISTNAGDDYVENRGTVSAMTIVDGVEDDGIAIDLGSGADVLMLGAESITIGAVDLGEGDDTLMLAGSPIIESFAGEPLAPTGNSGVDELRFIGSGSLTSIPADFERAVKVGVGGFDMVELPTVEYLRIEEGELLLGSEYIFADDGLFEVVFYADGRNGRLSVDGAAHFGGEIRVQREGDEFISDGTRYTLVSAAGTMDDVFGSSELPEAMPLLHFELDQGLSNLDLVAVADSFETVAENPMQRRVANNLYGIAGESSGQFSRVLGRMQMMPNGFGRALQSFSPDIHQVANEGATKMMQQGTMLLQSHLRSSRMRYREGGGVPEPLGKLAMYYSSAGYGGITLAGAAAGATGRIGPRHTRSQSWALGMASRGDYDAVSGYTAFEQDTDAFAAGYDFQVNNKLLLGLSAGIADTSIEMADAFGDGSVDGWFASAYGTRFSADSFLEWGLGYGRQDIETTRLLEVDTDMREASAAHDGDIWNLFLGAGKLYSFDRWLVEPFAAVRYFRLSEDAFEETGADSLNQRIESRDVNAVFGELGVNLGQRMPLENGNATFDWNIMLGVNHDFGTDDRTIRYSYAGQPNDLLSLDGRNVSGTSGLLGGTLAWYGDRFGLNLEYRGRFNSEYDEQSIAGIFLLQF